MIKRYTDHSANERTYLAWIRTAIAIMAFGFLIEKFEVFLSYISHAVTAEDTLQPSPTLSVIGLILILIGIVVIMTASFRYFAYKRLIDAEEVFPFGAMKMNILLSLLMISIGGVFLFYIGHQLV